MACPRREFRQHGYKIVFDDDSLMFGLATCGQSGSDVFIGFHGIFLETLTGM